MATSKSKNIRYIPAVDHLRAYAALLVVLYHCAFMLIPLQYDNWPKTGNPFMSLIYEGHTGVALFLVLSGFIFTYGSAGREIEYKPFILNRILRIYPLLIVLAFVGVAVYGSQINATQVLELLLPVQNIREVSATTYLGPYNTVFWTITVEFQFYLIFPFLHQMLLRRGIRGLVPLFVFLLLMRWSALMVRDSAKFTSILNLTYWTMLGRLDQFLIGMITATVARRLTLDSRLLRLALPLGVVGLMLSLFLFNQMGGWPVQAGWKIFWPPCEAALWALIILGYVALLNRRDGWISKAIAGVGTISYSIYLLHMTVLDIISHHGWMVHTPRPPFLSALFTGLACVFPLTVLVSTLTYHAIEKPFLERRRRYLDPAPGMQPTLDLPVMVTADEPGANAVTPTRTGVIGCFVGVSVFIVAALFFAVHLRGAKHVSIPTRTVRLTVEHALAISHETHPSACRVLVASDEYASTAVAVGLELARAKEPFVVVGGKWKNSFGLQHAWRSLDAAALKNGLSAWYIMPRSMLLWGLIADHPRFLMGDGLMLVLAPPTLELSTAGNTLEMDFGSNGHAKDFAVGGWGDADPGGAWSIEPSAAFIFHPRVIEGIKVEISLDVQPLLAPEHGLTRQRLRLLFNGIPIGPEQQVSTAGTVRFTIPEAIWNAEAAKLDATVSLVFEIPDAVAPVTFGPDAGSETRKLGFFFTKMQLRVVP